MATVLVASGVAEVVAKAAVVVYVVAAYICTEKMSEISRIVSSKQSLE